MRMMIRYEGGLRVEGVLLAASPACMRIAINSQNDTLELNRVNETWYTDKGTAIEIEALIPLAGTDVSRFCSEIYPRANAAGHSFLSD